VAPKTTNTGQIAEFRLMGATHKSDTSRTASIVLGNYDQDFTSTKFMGSISGETTNNAQNEGDMVFYRYPDGKTATEAIRIERFGDISFHSGTDSYTFPTTRGTNNQVLSTDASGSLSWTGIPSSADNLGNHTATTNVELGGNWLSNDGGNEGIQIDNSGNVGIGTTTPNGALHIGNSAGGFRKVILFENSNNDYQYYGFGISPSSLRYSVAATAARHLFVAGNSANSTDTLMVIQGNGNVGIGTFSPSDQLEVVGGITTDGFKLSGNGAGATKVLTSDGTGNATWQAVPSSADNLGNHTATSNIQLNSNWLSNDGGNEGIRVTDAGDIGIGTGSPQTQLHLHTAASAGNYMQITNGTSTTRGLQVGINNAGVAYILQKENFDFKIRTNDIDRLTIQADGDVGIGTATPAFALDVAGDVMANDNNFIVLDSAGNNIEFSGQGNASYASYGAYIRTTSNPSSGEAIFRVLSSGGAERLRVEHSGYVRTVDGLTVEGNVGIGNTTPAVELDVTGDAQVSGKTTTATFQMTTGSALNGKVLTADGSGNGTWETIPSSADDLGNHTATSNIQLNNNWLSNDGGNEGIRVTDAGDVGIGTDSPTGLFTISDNSRNMLTLKRSTTNDDSTGIVFQNTGNAYTWNMYLNASQDLVFSSSNGNTNIDALSPKVFFDNDGNVGIGTITPTAQLHVNGTAAADGSTGQIQIDETGGNSMMLGRTSSFGFIQTQNSEPLVLNPTSNNVGIGTSSPASLVHMHDATAPYLQLSNSTTGSTASDGFRLGISGNHVFFRNYENGDIRFRTQDQNRMVVLGNGDVGVGTASPLSKFHVAGGTILVDNSNGLAYRNAANSGNRNMIKSTSGDDVIIAGTNTNNIEFDVSGGNDAMYMESGGFIGMGTTNPIRKLDVRDNTSGVVLRVENNSSTTGAGGMALALNVASPGTSDNFIYFLGNGSTVVGSVTGGGSGGVAYNTTSDRRLKTNIAAFTSGLELISEIDPKIYERKSNLGNKEIGFIAQELMKSFPGAVSGDSTNNVDEKPMLVDYSKLTPVLTAGIKELHQMVLEQQALISSQKFEIEQLKAAREEDISKQAETESRLNAIEKLLLTGAVIEE
ncbi:MAG: tail fiber domain-containing protein, partial [Salibacteraceae bacterium]